jgi:hypothetical protein
MTSQQLEFEVIPGISRWWWILVKVEVNLKLEQAMKLRIGSRGIALLFFNLGARWGGWATPRLGRFTPG